MSNQKRQQGFSVLKNVVNRQEQQRQNEESGYFANLARTGLGQGVAFGFGDEIEAGVGAAYDKFVKGKDFTDSYADRKENIDENISQFRESNPVAAYGSEVVGSIGTGALAVPKLLAKGATKISSKLGSKKAQDKLKDAAANTYIQGAVSGGLYGAGTGEGSVADRASNAAMLAAASPVLQKGITAATPVITQAGKNLLEKGIKPTASQLFSEGALKGSKFIPAVANQFEQMISSYPGVGLPIARQKINALRNFNFSIIDDALEPIGEKVTRNDTVLGKTAQVIDKVTGGKTQLANKPFAQGKPSFGDVKRIDSEKAINFGVSDALEEGFAKVNVFYDDAINSLGNITTDNAKAITNITKNIATDLRKVGVKADEVNKVVKKIDSIMDGTIFNKTTTKATKKKPKITKRTPREDLTGQKLVQIRREILDLKKNRRVIQDEDTIQYLDDLLDQINKTLPKGASEKLNQANMSYARLKTMERAVDKGSRTQGLQSGEKIMTPRQYKKQVELDAKKAGLQKPNTQTKAYQLSNDADSVMGSNFPDSGTASRLLLQGNIPGVIRDVLQRSAAAVAGYNPVSQAILRSTPGAVRQTVSSPVAASGILNTLKPQDIQLEQEDNSLQGLLERRR